MTTRSAPVRAVAENEPTRWRVTIIAEFDSAEDASDWRLAHILALQDMDYECVKSSSTSAVYRYDTGHEIELKQRPVKPKRKRRG